MGQSWSKNSLNLMAALLPVARRTLDEMRGAPSGAVAFGYVAMQKELLWYENKRESHPRWWPMPLR